MALAEGQVRIRDLVMGPGTDFIISHFNPWNSLHRADYSGTNPYRDGGWSGPEYRDPVAVNFTVHSVGNTASGWQELHWKLLAALRPVRNEPIEPELHWRSGGREYMMYARPRGINPQVKNMWTGDVTTACSLEALDPSIYSGGENGLHSATIGQYRTTGGLAVPFGLPVGIRTVPADGLAVLTNIGITPASLKIRINGPVDTPTIATYSDTAGSANLWFDLALSEGEWLDIDTEEMSVYLNGIFGRLSEARGTFPLLHTGNTEIKFLSNDDQDPATAVFTWRDRW